MGWLESMEGAGIQFVIFLNAPSLPGKIARRIVIVLTVRWNI